MLSNTSIEHALAELQEFVDGGYCSHSRAQTALNTVKQGFEERLAQADPDSCPYAARLEQSARQGGEVLG